jgi:hypothetical protein
MSSGQSYFEIFAGQAITQAQFDALAQLAQQAHAYQSDCYDNACAAATGCDMTDEERVQMLRAEVKELVFVLSLIARNPAWFAKPLQEMAASALRRPQCPAMGPEFEGQRDAWLRGG